MRRILALPVVMVTLASCSSSKVSNAIPPPEAHSYRESITRTITKDDQAPKKMLYERIGSVIQIEHYGSTYKYSTYDKFYSEPGHKLASSEIVKRTRSPQEVDELSWTQKSAARKTTTVFSPPFVELKAPVKVGTKWHIQSKSVTPWGNSVPAEIQGGKRVSSSAGTARIAAERKSNLDGKKTTAFKISEEFSGYFDDFNNADIRVSHMRYKTSSQIWISSDGFLIAGVETSTYTSTDPFGFGDETVVDKYLRENPSSAA